VSAGAPQDRGRVFEYVGFDLSPAGLLTCHYRLDAEVFAEEIDCGVSGGRFAGADVEAAARLVFLLAGVSYYKTAAPPLIVGPAGGLTSRERDFLLEVYLSGLAEFSLTSGTDLRGLRIAVACAHGAAYQVAGPVLHELGADVVAIGAQPDGVNINHDCGATHSALLQAAVRDHEADIGIALDGDGDRVVMTDGEGMLYDGDQLLYIIARHRQQKGLLKGGVAGTLMTNLAVENSLKKLDIPFARANVGDRYVLELLQKKNWQLGGEGSGHILCIDKHTTGDGIISALQVLYAIRDSVMNLAELARDVTLYPQKLINVRVPKGFDTRVNGAIKATQEEAERDLDGSGRVLLRASGTEPLVRVMVEGESKQKVNHWAERIADVVRNAAGSESLSGQV